MRSNNLQSFSNPETVVQLWRGGTGVVEAPVPLLIEHTRSV